MSRYIGVRIELNSLDPNNDKLEYRFLYRALHEEKFCDTYFDSEGTEWSLPPGIHAIEAKNCQTPTAALIKARSAIEVALSDSGLYPSTWVRKYNITVFGLGPILGENLEPME